MISSLLINGAVAIALAAVPIVSSTVRIPSLAGGVSEAFVQIAKPTIELAKEEVPAKPKVRVLQTMRVPATAYSSTPDQTDSTPFITANGSHVHDGTLAANFLRFGTKVRLPEIYGDKVFVVEDRMNRRYPYRVDVWMETREAARKFGYKKSVLIEVIQEEEALATR